LLDASAITEGWLIPVALVLIGLKYGFGGLGMAFVGWLIVICAKILRNRADNGLILPSSLYY
jgi:hypothetical protein